MVCRIREKFTLSDWFGIGSVDRSTDLIWKRMVNAAELAKLQRLKQILQDADASLLERLAAVLFGKLLGVTVAVARAGFQHGGDAGPAGRQGRNFRIESKRYADTTPLSERELLGEIDHALKRDPALEAWILVSTREVSEQVEQSLYGHGESIGVPIIVVDWKSQGLPILAALCCSGPDEVKSAIDAEAGDLARQLQPIASDALERLTRDLQAWTIGFESVRVASHEYYRKIWLNPRTANAKLGQNAAVGSIDNRLPRRPAHDGLDSWLSSATSGNWKPAAVLGFDGVGKTWAVVDWLYGRLDDLPIVVVIPASALTAAQSSSAQSIMALLASRLFEITNVRDAAHWARRLELLLSSPVANGPVMTVFFDGLNQQPSAPWIDILKTFQDEPFVDRIGVIFSTRKHHFEDRLGRLRSLIDRPTEVGVEIYDDAPDGEFDRMLAFKGLNRADLQEDLIPMARTPRLFNLVVDFREGLIGVGKVTPHRVLWEYGRRRLADHAGRSFSESDWRTWLQDIAKGSRSGIETYSVKALGKLTDRGDLPTSDVYARLSEIIDGQLAVPAGHGDFLIKPEIVSHALGLALISHLEQSGNTERAGLFAAVDNWLDPISGMDQRAEILRAAVSILVEMGSHRTTLCEVLLTAWLQTQNIPETHRKELCALAGDLVSALMAVIEESPNHAHAAARSAAVLALRGLPRDVTGAFREIVATSCRWLLDVSRDVRIGIHSSREAEEQRSKRWLELVGVDQAGQRLILGKTVNLTDGPNGIDDETIPVLLEGFPLAEAVSVFESAALQIALRGSCDCWEKLKWLCLLNVIDACETSAAIRTRAASLASAQVETGIDPRLRTRVASLILRMSTDDADEDTANRLEPGIHRIWSYERDYLADPANSFFTLERRHADEVLRNKQPNLWRRLQRTKDLWLDPTFTPPPELTDELREFAATFNVAELSAHGGHSREDIDFEAFEPMIARCAPDLLASIIRRKIRGFEQRPIEARYWSAIHVSNHSLLIDKSCEGALQLLREKGAESDEDQEFFAVTSFLMIELADKTGFEQVQAIIESDLKHILVDWVEILKPLSAEDGDRLIARYRSGTLKQQRDLILLINAAGFKPSEDAWGWIAECAMLAEFPMRHTACEILVRADAARSGRYLQSVNWCWDPTGDKHINHYCTLALIESCGAIPFEQLAPRLAPWLIPRALAVRGGDESEALLAAEIFGSILVCPASDSPDLGSKSLVNQNDRSDNPFSFAIEIPATRLGEGDPSTFVAAMDPERQHEVRKRAVSLAIERIQEARSAGASFFLVSFDPKNLVAMVRHAPQQLEIWLEGMEACSDGFKRRLRLAEGAYLALCEALFELIPDKGGTLWRALRRFQFTKYLGTGQVDELINMPFRVAQSAETEKILSDLVDLNNANTDGKLMELAIAAQSNGRGDWLRAIIAEDLRSGTAWRRMRATVFEGFLNDGSLPNDRAWPEGGFLNSRSQLVQRSAKSQWSDSCARHWWRRYRDATDAETAYAAWVLFLRSADRRAWTWLKAPEMSLGKEIPLGDSKLRQCGLNKEALKRALQKREEKRDEQLFGRKIGKGFGPWRDAD